MAGERPLQSHHRRSAQSRARLCRSLVSAKGLWDPPPNNSTGSSESWHMKSSPKRIVIFGINYAPELPGIAPYTTAVAEHYASEGHWVRVVTGVPHYPQWRGRAVPAGIGAGNPSVVRYRHFVPQQANALGRMAYEATWFISASRSLASQGVEVVIGIVPSLSGGVLALVASA